MSPGPWPERPELTPRNQPFRWVRVDRAEQGRAGAGGVKMNESTESQGMRATTGREKNPVCVIGMHRSGTSMVARLLAQRGVYLGPPDQLLEPKDSNPNGHFENQGILKINNALLTHWGGSWHAPPEFPAGWECHKGLDRLRDEASDILEGLAREPIWGWKEPRTTILLPFWKSLVDRPRFVICLRNPVEIANSLVARNGIPFEKAISLSEIYLRSAVRDTQGAPRLFVFYEDFFDERLVALILPVLFEFCGLDPHEGPEDLMRFVEKGLRHQRCASAEVILDDRVSTDQRTIYLALRALSWERIFGVGGPRKDESSEATALDRLLRWLEEIRDESRVGGLQALLHEKDREIVELKFRLHEIGGRLDMTQNRLADRARELDAVCKSVSWRVTAPLRRLSGLLRKDRAS